MKKWLEFWICKLINVFDFLIIIVVLEFFIEFFDRGYFYIIINLVRSVFSFILLFINGLLVGLDLLIRCFMRGVVIDCFNLLWYMEIWDVSIVLFFICSMGDNEVLFLFDYMLKFFMLLVLVIG